MKKIMTIMLSLAMAASFAACSAKETTVETTVDTGLWANATYVEDATIGEGAKEIELTVAAEDKTVLITIYTDADTFGEALRETEIAKGSESEYGLFIDTVNGMLADYDATGAYWAFYIDGEYASVGVDGAELSADAINVFALVYEVYEG